MLVHLEIFKGLHKASVDSDLHPTVTAFGQSAEACYLPSAAFLVFGLHARQSMTILRWWENVTGCGGKTSAIYADMLLPPLAENTNSPHPCL